MVLLLLSDGPPEIIQAYFPKYKIIPLSSEAKMRIQESMLMKSSVDIILAVTPDDISLPHLSKQSFSKEI